MLCSSGRQVISAHLLEQLASPSSRAGRRRGGSDEIDPFAATVSNVLCPPRKLCIRTGTAACLLFLPAGFASLPGGRRLIDRELVELAALSDEGREPPRSSATACPRLAARSAILRRNFAPFQRRTAAQSGPKIARSAAAFGA